MENSLPEATENLFVPVKLYWPALEQEFKAGYFSAKSLHDQYGKIVSMLAKKGVRRPGSKARRAIVLKTEDGLTVNLGHLLTLVFGRGFSPRRETKMDPRYKTVLVSDVVLHRCRSTK